MRPRYHDTQRIRVLPPRREVRGRAAVQQETDSDSDGSSIACIAPIERDNGGETCELHAYERRIDTRGDVRLLRVGTESQMEIQKERSHEAALVLTRTYDPNGELKATDLEIRSPHILKALQDVVKSYPGVNIQSSTRIIISGEPRCLFHYREELKTYAMESRDPKIKKHLRFCLRYMAQSLSKEITGFDITVRGATAEPVLEHRNLWMAYKPGVLLYQKRNGIEGLLILRQMDFKKRKDTRLDSWGITSYFIKSNGDSVGHVRHFVIVQHYDGCKPLCQMPIFPLCFHPEKERIASNLLERGKKYLSMLGVHHCFYDGVAKLSNYHSPGKFHSSSVKSRVMIDCQRFYRDTGSPVEFIAGCPVLEVESGNHINLRDEDVMTCPAYIQGYSLANKLWGFFEVAKLHEVKFDMDAFGKLVLEEGAKQLIFSLVQSRESRKLEFDDHIKGKGKGLIFLLHGPPGVGKTLTAESIADQTRRPLVTLHSGQIIGTSPFVERRLENILSLVTRWNAVVLLDEADVFMQERAVHELERNALVSTLLRIVEYFDGIMFLTTNRFESIDTAFKSRIHLAVSYPPLSTDSKKELWRESVTRACCERRPPWVTARFLKAVAESPLNGREIKNTVGMAHALAQNGKRPMKPEDIFQGIQAMQSFESDFNAHKTIMGSTKRLVSAPKGVGSHKLPTKRPWWRFW